MKGLGMASMPSCGQMSTTEVPRHTTRPSWRVSSVSLYWSSGSAEEERAEVRTSDLAWGRMESEDPNQRVLRLLPPSLYLVFWRGRAGQGSRPTASQSQTCSLSPCSGPETRKSSGNNHPKPVLILQMRTWRPKGPQGCWVVKLIGGTGA